MGQCPAAMTLERVNNNRNYWKGNCVWATTQQQMQNTCSNVLVTWQLQTKTVAEWARYTGLKEHTLRQRLSRLHWSVEKSLTTVARQIKPKVTINT
jgi:hypothetical protein